MFLFKSKKDKKKEEKTGSTQVSSNVTRTSVETRTTVTKTRVERTKYEHNTFPKRFEPPKSPSRKVSMFTSQPSISEIKTPINPNYVSPYRPERSKDLKLYKPREVMLPSMKDSIMINPVRNVSKKIPTNFYTPSTLQTPPAYKSTLAPETVPKLTQPLKALTANLENTRLSRADMDKNMNIVVKTNLKFYDTNNKVPTYQTHGSQRGHLLLINNIVFTNSKDREGAEVDEKNLKSLFEKLNFRIECSRNMKKREMVSYLKAYSKKSKLKSVDINLVIIMSHGDGHKSGVTNVCGTDDEILPVSDIVDMFNNVNCPNLKNKPKIFMFMCCRGSNEAHTETDVKTSQSTVTTDMLLAYSTVPGFVSYRNSKFGTYYTQALCNIFMEHACDTHVEDMLKMVDSNLKRLVAENAGMAQTSSYENRGFKLCYLHPQKK